MEFIVADSGGSGTSLAFYESPEAISYIETAALHPKFLLQWKEEELAKIRSGLPEDLAAPLFFYGSGCSRPNIAYEVKQKLLSLGFSDVTVFPDTLGACRAVSTGIPASVAILGTGSVLLEFDGELITGMRGGFGALVGDEGSGFHFGKLLLHALMNNQLDDTTKEAVISRIGHPEQIRAELASHNAQHFIAGIAEKLSGIDMKELHGKNLSLFLDNYFNEPEKTLHVVGSYGFYQQEILAELLRGQNCEKGSVIRNPIAELVKFHAKNT